MNASRTHADKFEVQTALVTGSTAGIGFAIARALSETGATVVINGQDTHLVNEAVQKIPGSRGVVADLSSAEGCSRLLKEEPKADIVVNSIGMYKPGDFFDTDDSVWEAHWNLNVMSGVRLARGYLPPMRAAHWGRFIILASEDAFAIPVKMIHYGVSKTADVSLARGLAKLMAGSGVTVNSVLPGPTLSDGFAAMLKSKDKSGRSVEELAAEAVKRDYPNSLLKRMISVEEIANMVVYLSSEQASATTGAAVRVDGGILDTLL